MITRLVTVRRLLWSAGVGLDGFLIDGIGRGDEGSILGAIWGASIGYGFGSIFDHRHASRRIVLYWGAMLALVAPFFTLIASAGVEPYGSTLHQAAFAILGGLVGALCGVLIGKIQLHRLRRWPPSDNL